MFSLSQSKTHPLFRFAPVACALSLFGPLGCAEPDDVEPTEYVDGESQLTDGESFELVLWHSDGQPVLGQNDFRLEVFGSERSHQYIDPVLGARVAVDCYMPNEPHTMPVDAMVEPKIDGTFALRHIVFDRPGVWQMDFDVAVGEEAPETASFSFVVE